ncbi:RHS repeat-associated core domain-containing protein [Methylocaldum szegediense]|uniref:RHS repeat-associated core domain-containing protein n=1 Tax=Methylocaldum szegediense TaxID=73780 RepID=UPI000407B3FE|nr:RHS repeat-associated core domain-containing protein [Methylocaldum szegediense]
MMPAAKHGDPQLGVDIHLCTTPVPTPLPTPHISVVFDPFDYIPIIGATVTVCGMKRATAGTAGMVVHIPPGFPFAPKFPDTDDELFMGSSTVIADGDPFSYISLPVLGCQVAGMVSPFRLRKKGGPRIMVLPTTFNLAIPTTVFVGGPPTISMMGLAFKAGFAALGKLAKSGVFKRFRQKLFKNMKPGFLKCTVLRAEPVNILNGEVSVEQQDFELPGRIPLRWVRSYGSSGDFVGLCGIGWQTPADIRLEYDSTDGSVLMHGPEVGPIAFERLPAAVGEQGAELELMDGARLIDTGDEYRVTTKDDRIYHFPKSLARRDPRGRLCWPIGRLSDRCGNALDFEYRGGRIVAINESAGRRLTLTLENDRLTAVTLHDPASRTEHTYVRYQYDEAGDLVAVIDPLGEPYRFAYDAHRMVRHTDRNGLSFHYAYEQAPDGSWRVIHAWGDGGLYDYRFDYSDLLNERCITDSLGQVTLIKLDERGLPINETDPLGGMTIYEYDDAGRTTAVVDPDGHRTEYTYDERGNLLKLTRPDGHAITTEFDENDKTVRITDPNGGVWQQAWDRRGLLIEQKTPLGHVSRYEYDAHGQLVAYTNPRGAHTELRFDAFGNLIGIKDALGHVTRFAYDPLGNLIGELDPLGRKTLYRYDAKGRLTAVRLPSGATVHCGYDAEDNLTRYVDENGAETRLEYFGQGEIAKRIQPDGHTVQYHYDTEERLIGVTNQRGETYRLERDALGRIIEEVDYWGQSRRYDYTLAGHLRRSVDPLGRAIHYRTDPLGRIVEKALPDPDGGDKPWIERFAYDANGNLIGCANPEIRIERRFDPDGRLIEEKQGETFTLRNAYDEAGNRIARHTEFKRGDTVIAHAVRYAYDALDQAIEIAIDDHAPIAIERDATGRIVRERLSPSLRREVDYSADGYLTRQRTRTDADTVVDLAYDYDAAGNLTERRDAWFGIDRYVYDPVGRITQHLDPHGQVKHYLNDPAGDRLTTRIVEHEAAQTGTPNAQGEWSREGEYEGAFYRFDRAGNLIERHDRRGALHLRWDANQRLIESRLDGVSTRYRYDPLGRRIEKRTGDQITTFAWDGDALVGDWIEDPTDPVVPAKGMAREWVYYPETFEPLALLGGRSGPNTLLHYHNDPNGCPIRLTDSKGEVLWAASYTAWGQIARLHVGYVDNPIRLQGQYEDGETGLYYNRNRYFSSEAGIFIIQDPLGLLAGPNLYRISPNVFRWIDPLGLACRFKMQPYRYSDVRVKGPHGDVISEKGYKITEGRLVIDNGVLAWKRFGDMGKATKGELREADRLLSNLTNDQTVMAQARRQVEMVIEDLTRDLNHKNKATRELADRQLQYFKRMLELF